VAAGPNAFTFDTLGLLLTPSNTGIASENRLRLFSFLLHNKRRAIRKNNAIPPIATPTTAPVDSFLDSLVEEVSFLLPNGALSNVTSVVLFEMGLWLNERRVFNVGLGAAVVDIVESKDDAELGVGVIVEDAILEGADIDVVGSGSEFVITR
jgi:hypothetical protein